MLAFVLCFVAYGGSGLAAGWSSAQGIPPTVYMIKKLWNRGQGSSWTVAPTDCNY
jgi:hypothetical protein